MSVTSPAMVLIDHGHFQFNCVSLGLCAWAVALVVAGHARVAARGVNEGGQHPQNQKQGGGCCSQLSWMDLAGSAAFVGAICYKQIALYFAPAFFFYLLGRCVRGRFVYDVCVCVCVCLYRHMYIYTCMHIHVQTYPCQYV